MAEQTDPVNDFVRSAIERCIAVRAADPPAPDKALKAADAAIERARRAMLTVLDEDTPFSAVVARAVLEPAEAEVLALAIMIELDESLQRLVAALTGDRQRRLLEVGMIADLLGPEHPGPVTVGPDGGLQRAALIELEGNGGFSRTIIHVADRVLWALLGDSTNDQAMPVSNAFLRVPNPQTDDPMDAVIVRGRDRIRRRQAAATVLGRPFAIAVDPPSGAAADAAWAAIVREATLNAASVIVEVDGLPDDHARRWIERANHIPWALSGPAAVELSNAPRVGWRFVEASDDEPTDEEWVEVLGDVPRLHRLSADQLEQMRLALPAHDGNFAAAFRSMVSPKLEKLASHVRPRHGWDDLILDPLRKAQLGDLINRYRNAHRVYDEWGVAAVPSRGLVALFSGPSGTGKTLGAEVVAGELGLDLYKLDLSSVVSKWIGETEKNLDELFAAAGAGNFVLFFDEADALFAKRGAVNDSHDRYANVETSYLLQRLERYDGVVIMATNYEKNIDEAFMRRIHVRVDFAMPDAAARRDIWRRHTSSVIGLGDGIDFAWLAERFEIPGAAIKNATVDAAFLAAADDAKVEMSYLVRGVARELRKLGRLITREQFGEWFDTVSTT